MQTNMKSIKNIQKMLGKIKSFENPNYLILYNDLNDYIVTNIEKEMLPEDVIKKLTEFYEEQYKYIDGKEIIMCYDIVFLTNCLELARIKHSNKKKEYEAKIESLYNETVKLNIELIKSQKELTNYRNQIEINNITINELKCKIDKTQQEWYADLDKFEEERKAFKDDIISAQIEFNKNEEEWKKQLTNNTKIKELETEIELITETSKGLHETINELSHKLSLADKYKKEHQFEANKKIKDELNLVKKELFDFKNKYEGLKGTLKYKELELEKAKHYCDLYNKCGIIFNTEGNEFSIKLNKKGKYSCSENTLIIPIEKEDEILIESDEVKKEEEKKEVKKIIKKKDEKKDLKSIDKTEMKAVLRRKGEIRKWGEPRKTSETHSKIKIKKDNINDLIKESNELLKRFEKK